VLTFALSAEEVDSRQWTDTALDMRVVADLEGAAADNLLHELWDKRVVLFLLHPKYCLVKIDQRLVV
jgi:hypothetical protein